MHRGPTDSAVREAGAGSWFRSWSAAQRSCFCWPLACRGLWARATADTVANSSPPGGGDASSTHARGQPPVERRRQPTKPGLPRRRRTPSLRRRRGSNQHWVPAGSPGDSRVGPRPTTRDNSVNPAVIAETHSTDTIDTHSADTTVDTPSADTTADTPSANTPPPHAVRRYHRRHALHDTAGHALYRTPPQTQFNGYH